jgi:hypothetical protein
MTSEEKKVMNNNASRSIVLLGVILIIAMAAFGATKGRVAPKHTWEQTAMLTASDGQPMGLAIAVSGNTVVVGAPTSDNGIGSAYVFTMSLGGTWTQVAKLTGSDSQGQFASSVAIDGNTIVAGTPGQGGGTGKLYVFVEPASGWKDMTETVQLSASNAPPSLGESVAINGGVIFAGTAGAICVYVQPESGWADAYQTAVLSEPGGFAAGNSDGLGYSLALSEDGKTLAAGVFAWPAGKGLGAVFVYKKPANGWQSATQYAVLSASNAIPGDQMGVSVAVDKNTVVAGTYNGNPSRYSGAYVFVKPASGWQTTDRYTAELTSGQRGDQFGWTVAKSGKFIVVGAPNAAIYSFWYEGAAYVYSQPAEGWNTTSRYLYQILPCPGYYYTYFGTAMAMEGNEVAVGAPATGAGYVFNIQ